MVEILEHPRSRRCWLTPEEVAEMLGMTLDQVRGLIRAKTIPAAKLSRKLIWVNAEQLA